MIGEIYLTDPDVVIKVKPNPRAKRLILRISNRDGQPTVTVPLGASQTQVETFVQNQRAWLRKHSKHITPPIILGYGDHIPLMGVPHELVLWQGKTIKAGDGVIAIPARKGDLAPRLKAYLKLLARDQLVPIAAETASNLGRQVSGYSFRDTRSRWGSCSSDGRLMFSWRLVMTPPAVLRYVAVHEACHLVEMNHSKRFWALVAEQMPEYASAQAWLRREGAHIQRIAL